MLSEEQMDLKLAAELQAALLPESCPLECEHQVAAARNRMCGSVGGDFYDFIRLNEDQSAIVVGDVVGHGVRAALLMAQIKGFLESGTQDRSRPLRMVEALNDMLCRLGDRTDSVLSCSMIYTVFDAPSGTCFMCNCGHPRPLLCQRDQCALAHLGGHNILLGIEPFAPTEICHTFLPGERLVLYTDGICDAANPQHDPFGEDRLRQALRQRGGASPQECADAVMQAVDAFRDGAAQIDDETIVVIDRV